MKTALTVLVSFFLLTNVCLAQWFWQNPLPQGNDIYSMSFYDSMHGFAVGPAGTILRTSNGGVNWALLQNAGLHNFYSVSSISEQSTFVTSDSGLIIHTTNDGIDWTEMPINTSLPLGGISFIDENNGLLIEGMGTMLRTTNGGYDWEPFAVLSEHITGYAYIDINTVTAVVYTAGNTRILRTTDAGNSWITQFSIGFAWSNAVSFKDIDNGIVVFSNNVYTTTNGGTVWTERVTGYQEELYAISYIAPDNAAAVGNNGLIIYSSDGGINWTPQESNVSSAITNVQLIDPFICYAAGEEGHILKSSNGIWQDYTSGPRDFLASVDFINSNIGIAVGGAILKTTNGGLTWSDYSGTLSIYLRSISFVSENSCTTVGDNGTIMHSTNGGIDWFIQSSGTTDDLSSVCFTDNNHGWAVGANGTILKTTNAGSMWVPLNITSQYLNCIWFTDMEHGTIVGGDWWLQNGLILNTTDGGTTWNSQISGVNKTLSGVYFSNADNGVAVAGEGTVIRTTNGGNDWYNVQSNTYSWLNAVSFTDENHGLAVGSRSSVSLPAGIIKTTNGGEDWIPLNSGVTERLSGVSYIDSNSAVVVGAYGTILRNDNVAIPVELTSFNAYAEGEEVHLNWSTSTETNNSGFDIEKCRSSEISDQTGWGKIGFVEGNGTTTEIHFYSFTDNKVTSGKYLYRLKQIDLDGSCNYSKIVEVELTAPDKFSLQQNYPNPFNPVTHINYQIPVKGFVSLKVYNTLGEEVATLVNEEKAAGSYKIKFNCSGLSSGIYIYRLTSGNYTSAKKLNLIK